MADMETYFEVQVLVQVQDWVPFCNHHAYEVGVVVVFGSCPERLPLLAIVAVAAVDSFQVPLVDEQVMLQDPAVVAVIAADAAVAMSYFAYSEVLDLEPENDY